MGRTACTEPQCLYSKAIPLLPLWAVRSVQNLSARTVELYLYSPYGPYGLYSRAIPLLPLWAVRPVQSLNACTRVHFTFINFMLVVVIVVSVTECVFLMISLNAAKRAASSVVTRQDVVRSAVSSGAIKNAACKCSMWK
jgi:hypothetical protein